MRALKKSFLYLSAFVLLVSCNEKKTVEADYTVIPLPQNISKTEGEGFALNENTLIVYTQNDEIQKQTAEFLSEYLKFNTGLSIAVTDRNADENVIILKADYKGPKTESYQLTVDKNRIIINGSDNAGTFYGVQTLRKSIPADSENSEIVFPAVDIKDFPRFDYRGMMLDVGRHLFPVEFIKKYIDLLALHNINRFHWSLTQDQGWRIEIKKYPELTQTGAQRKGTVIGRNSGEYDGKPYGGFYTQEEVKDIVAYAQKRFITIIPEVNHPGHMLAALATYPHLGCTGGPYEVEQRWGVFDDVLCAGNEEIYTFLENVYSEIIELFPSEYIHVGGDESPKVRWQVCPKCQAKIKKLGLKSDAHHTKEERLQSYVISRTEKFLNSKGRQIIGWDEILEGGLAPNATVMSWRGTQGGIEAAKQNHDVVMVPNNYLYFDYYQTRDVKNEPLGIGGYVPIENVYNYEPVPSELSEEQKKHIIGLQANLWTEYINNSDHVEYMVLPRMAALAEVQWTSPEKKDYDAFLPRLTKFMQLYGKLGYNYATHIYDIKDQIDADTDKGAIILTLSTFDDAPIYYTTDGTEPTSDSKPYTKPIEITSTTEIKAVAIRETGKSRVYANAFNFNKATLKNVQLTHQPNKSYPGKGAITLVNGKRGSDSFGDGEWLGYSATDFEAVIDLNEKTDLSKITMGTYVEAPSWIFGVTEYIVSLSDDGNSYKKVYHDNYPVITEEQAEAKIIDHVAEFDTDQARFIKINAKRTNPIPAWHAGKGNPGYIFIDEIIVD